MWTSLLVLVTAAALTGAACLWGLRAYKRAGGGEASPAPALISCALISTIALLTYLFVGRPELPDAPYAARLEALKQRDPRSYSAEEALAILNEAARERPEDPLPHFYAGQLLLGQGRAEEAARAYDAALRRDPRSAEALMGLGRAMVSIEGGVVSPEALAAFEQASTLTNDPAPWIYQAMAAMERNDESAARRLWGEAYERMAIGDPRREMALRMSQGLPQEER